MPHMFRVPVVSLLSRLALATAHADALPEEVHLGELTQLTFGGENAEAYWRFDGRKVILPRRAEGMGCDQIDTLDIFRDGKVVTNQAFWPLHNGWLTRRARVAASVLRDRQPVQLETTFQEGKRR